MESASADLARMSLADAAAPGAFVLFRGLQGAADLNGHVGVVLTAANEKERIGVLALEADRSVLVKADNLEPSTSLQQNCDAVFAGLALRERVGALTTPNPAVMSSNPLDFMGLIGNPLADMGFRVPAALPRLTDFVSKAQYVHNHRGPNAAIAACNQVYFAVKYICMAARPADSLPAMDFSTAHLEEMPAAQWTRQQIDRFLSSGALSVLCLELNLPGISHPAARAAGRPVDCHAICALKCGENFRVLDSCCWIYRWSESLARRGWMDASAMRDALEAAVELAFGTDRDAVGQLAERALGDARFDATAEYTTAPTNRDGKEAGVIFADGLDAQKMLAAGVGLVQEMRRQGI